MKHDEAAEAPFDPDGLSGLSDDDIVQFLEEKKVRLSCGECGYPQTHLATMRNGKIPTIISTEITPNLNNAIINFYFEMICMNCGHVRLFERGIVSQWKQRKLQP